MPLIDTFHKNYNDEVVPRILEVCIEMDKVAISLGFPSRNQLND